MDQRPILFFDSGVGAAEAGDELAIGDRSDPGRADEPKS